MESVSNRQFSFYSAKFSTKEAVKKCRKSTVIFVYTVVMTQPKFISGPHLLKNCWDVCHVFLSVCKLCTRFLLFSRSSSLQVIHTATQLSWKKGKGWKFLLQDWSMKNSSKHQMAIIKWQKLLDSWNPVSFFKKKTLHFGKLKKEVLFWLFYANLYIYIHTYIYIFIYL